MKKYFTIIKSIAALLIAGAALTACTSDDNTGKQPVTPAQKTYTLTVNATKGNSAQTRALSLSGNTLTATWATTDKVYVMKGYSGSWATGYLQPQKADESTTLSGTFSGISIAVGDELTLQFPKSGAASYSGQKGTLDDIAANFDYAKASSLQITAISDQGAITLNKAAEFENDQAIIKFTLEDKSRSAAINPTSLTVTDGTSTVTLSNIPAATYTTNGNGVLFVAFPAADGAKDITLTATVVTGNNTFDTYIYKKSSVTFADGNYYDISVSIRKAIDLGLPSGRLWASMNVGATSSEGYGDYFAWGETATKATYDWSNYKWGTQEALTRYNSTDGLTTLEAADDAARANWGGEWRMPTKADFEELINTNYTDSEWVSNYENTGVAGYKFTSKTNGNSIFFPAAGYRRDSETKYAGNYGRYWSSSLNDGSPQYAYNLDFDNGGNVSIQNKSVQTNDQEVLINDRFSGQSVRPVR